jgi:predicted O-methyltransferase YrrM
MGVDDLERLRQKALSCTGVGDPYLDGLNPQPRRSAFYRFLYFLVAAWRPEVSVELGVETGRGTAHLAAGYPSGQVIGVDPVIHGAMHATLQPYDNVRVIPASSDNEQVLQQFQARSVDICFIDSLHDGDYTLHEMRLWTPKMKAGGLFLFDDLTLNESMERVLPALPCERKGLLDGLHTFLDAGFGFAFV